MQGTIALERRIKVIRPLLHVLLVLMVIGLTGCFSDIEQAPIEETDDTPKNEDQLPEGAKEFTVGSGGGTFEFQPDQGADVKIIVNVPADALDGDETIVFSLANDFPSHSGLAPKTPVKMEPVGLKFKKPVGVTIVYDAALLGTIAEAGLRLHQVENNGWLLQPGSVVDMGNDKVTGEILNLSIWALVRKPCTWGGGAKWDQCILGN